MGVRRNQLFGWSLLVILCLAGCSAVAPATEWRPKPENGHEQTEAALDRLKRGDDHEALAFLERARELGTGRGQAVEATTFWRDISEVRFALGDGAGAAMAARNGSEQLARIPGSARFRDQDRALWTHQFQSLAAAGDRDLTRLEALANQQPLAHLADDWYLIGLLHERAGEIDSARAAYRAYLDRSPEFSLLRRARLMREHASAFVGPRS